MGLRRQRRRTTVKALPRRLQHAYQRDAGRLVRRLPVLLELLGHQGPMAVWGARWRLSPSWLSARPQALRRRGLDCWVSGPSGGRPPTGTPQQKQRVVALLEAAPLFVSCEPACGTAVLLRVLRGRAGGILSHRQTGWRWWPHLGFAFHQARVVSDPLDAAQRLAWRQDTGPALCRTAKRGNGLIRLAEQTSGATWGSLSATGAQ